jgi:hypothetical protein
MKKELLLLSMLCCCAVFMISCDKEDDNQPPDASSNPSPADAATGVSNTLVLSWTCSNPDGDSVKYDLYLESINPPNTLIASNLTTTSFALSSLESNITYYWRINALDSKGAASHGPVWRFTTSPENPPDGPVAYYPFNGNADDESGNGHNPTENGATLTEDRFGNANSAYHFDGYQEIIVPHSDELNIVGDMTISTWFNSEGPPLFSTAHTIITKRTSDVHANFPYLLAINYQYNIPSDYKKPIFVSASSGTLQYLQSSHDITNNTWNYIACTISGTNLKIFLNNDLVLNTTIDNQLRAGNTFPLLIGSGARSDKPAEQFVGKLDDIRIYNRALTEEEIQALYNEVK